MATSLSTGRIVFAAFISVAAIMPYAADSGKRQQKPAGARFSAKRNGANRASAHSGLKSDVA
jgi:hypothetical protein